MTLYKDKNVGVLMGGLSKEREVSLRTGKAVATALRSSGHRVVEIDVGRDVARQLSDHKVEVAFIALHGRYGEDGTIQGLLEIMGIPYTGSGPLASAICLDKETTKKLVIQEGVRTPKWATIQTAPSLPLLTKEGDGGRSAAPLPLPVIVKPNSEGSTIGMSIVKKPEDWKPALEEASKHDAVILIEQFITGTEVTVAVLDGKALPVLEIVPKGGFYDYSSKYTKGMTEYIVPARIEEKVSARLKKLSEKIFSQLKLSGVARMDYIIDASGQEWFLEVNTIPGMTETSLVPKAAAATGITFETLCEQILKGASLKI